METPTELKNEKGKLKVLQAEFLALGLKQSFTPL
jgi:hypothetical protein